MSFIQWLLTLLGFRHHGGVHTNDDAPPPGCSNCP
jgi:hypothetical protein